MDTTPTQTTTETHFRQTDGKFSVWAYTQPNRHGRPQHRVKTWYRGKGSPAPVWATCPSAAEAARQAGVFWQSHLDGLLDAPTASPATLGSLLKAFLDRPTLSPASVASYKQACGLLVAFLGADRDVSAVTKTAVEKWIASLTCKPVSKQTYLRNVSAWFKWALRQGFVKADPTAAVSVQMPRAGHTLRPWMQAQDWPAFLAKCPKFHRIRAEFVLHTGLRAGEVVAAQWSWIQGQGDEMSIGVPASKSARARAIPLDTRALALLAEAKATWGSTGYLFSKTGVGAGNFRRDTVEACEAAELPPVDFHGLRRSCGSHWLACGVDLFLVSRWLGHADVSTTAKHYAGLADGLSRSGMAKVNARLA